MNTRLALPLLPLTFLGVLAVPAAAYKVKVPTGGDIVTLTVPVINQSNDYIFGESFNQTSTGFVFASYDGQFSTLASVAPHSTGTVAFEFVAGGKFAEEDNFQLSLFGFTDPTTAATPDFTDNDPGLLVDLVSEDAGPCGTELNCKTYTLPYTITVPAAVPETSTAIGFGTLLVLGAFVLRAGKRQSSRQ